MKLLFWGWTLFFCLWRDSNYTGSRDSEKSKKFFVKVILFFLLLRSQVSPFLGHVFLKSNFQSFIQKFTKNLKFEQFYLSICAIKSKKWIFVLLLKRKLLWSISCSEFLCYKCLCWDSITPSNIPMAQCHDWSDFFPSIIWWNHIQTPREKRLSQVQFWMPWSFFFCWIEFPLFYIFVGTEFLANICFLEKNI